MNHTYLLRRFFAAYIDGVLICIVLLTIYVCYSLINGVSFFEINNPRSLELLALQASSIVIYYLAVEFSFGTTPGKRLLGLQILGLINHNRKARFLQVLKRTLMRVVPFEPFSILVSNEYIMWHDAVSKTKVTQRLKKEA
jgi:uncharacterized RDD family membrane protein YckC